MNKKNHLFARMFYSSFKETVERIEKSYANPEDRRSAIAEVFTQIVAKGEDSALLDFTMELVELERNWLSLDWKLDILEFSIQNCNNEMFLFELLAIVKNYINEIFRKGNLTRDNYSHIYQILTRMAQIFVEKKVYQTGIDLYKSMVSIGKTFNINPVLQMRGIYNAIELFEILEDVNSVFEMAVLGYEMASNGVNLPWKIAFERILEFSGSKLATTYLSGAEALAWQSNDVGTKNFVINSLRAMSLLLRAKKRLTPEIMLILERAIKILSRTKNLTPDEIEIINVLDLLRTNRLSATQLTECAETFLRYCDISFRPTVEVLLIIWNGTMIYSKTQTVEESDNSSNIYTKHGQVLISALISAVSTSMKETLKKSEDIKQIQHGSQTVLIETEGDLSLFVIADRETIELRQEMQGFVADILVADFFGKFKKRVVSLDEYAEFFDPFIKNRFKRFMTKGIV